MASSSEPLVESDGCSLLCDKIRDHLFGSAFHGAQLRFFEVHLVDGLANVYVGLSVAKHPVDHFAKFARRGNHDNTDTSSARHAAVIRAKRAVAVLERGDCIA